MRHQVQVRSLSSLLIACAAAAGTAAGCAPAAEQEAQTPAAPVDVSAEIMAANETFMAAMNAGDAARVAAMYTDDAVLYPPGSEAISGGPEAIAAFFQGALDSGVERAILETVEAMGMGEMAVEVGEVTLLAADGGAIFNGSYMVRWKRTDAGWRLHRDIWNSDVAPAP